LFAAKDVQLVVITTPNELHFSLAKEAMEAGKHVIVEKPFTVTSKEASELVEISKRTGLVCSIYQNRRWDGDFLTAKHIVENGQLGRLVEFESHFDRFRNFVKAGWRETDAPGSGMLFDLGAHLIDQGKSGSRVKQRERDRKGKKMKRSRKRKNEKEGEGSEGKAK
jgi:predicted dehydrogenase